MKIPGHQAIELNTFTLTFLDKEREERFSEWIAPSRFIQLRLALLLVSVLYAIYGYVEYLVIPDEVVHIPWAVHFGVVIPVILSCILLSWVKPLKHLFFPAGIATTFTAALSNLYLSYIFGTQSIYSVELYLMIFWIFTVAGFRLIPATMLSFMIMLLSILSTQLLHHVESQTQLVGYYFWFLCSITLAFLGGYLLEYSAKINFIKEEILEHAAHHDALTGLPNRALLNDRLEQAILHAKRHNNKVGCLYIDLDNFKKINDTLGHNVGDLLLKKVALRLQKNVRDSDTVSRLGGDEFTVLLNDMSISQDAINIANKIRVELERPFNLMDSNIIYISASIGIALFPEHGRSGIELSKSADDAMYQSKNTGKNPVTLIESAA